MIIHYGALYFLFALALLCLKICFAVWPCVILALSGYAMVLFWHRAGASILAGLSVAMSIRSFYVSEQGWWFTLFFAVLAIAGALLCLEGERNAADAQDHSHRYGLLEEKVTALLGQQTQVRSVLLATERRLQEKEEALARALEETSRLKQDLHLAQGSLEQIKENTGCSSSSELDNAELALFTTEGTLHAVLIDHQEQLLSVLEQTDPVLHAISDLETENAELKEELEHLHEVITFLTPEPKVRAARHSSS